MIYIKYVKKAKMWAKTTLTQGDKKLDQKIEWFDSEEEAKK